MGRLRSAVEQVEREDARKRDHVTKLSKQFAEQCSRANVRSRTKNMVFSDVGGEEVYGYLGAGPEGLFIAYRTSSEDIEDAANGFEPTFTPMEPSTWPVEWLRYVMEQRMLDELMEAMDEQLRALAAPAASTASASEKGESIIKPSRKTSLSVGEAIGLAHVLAVGVSDYDPASNFGRLRQCVHDAVEVARCFRDAPQLHSGGALVRELTSGGAANPSKGNITKEVRALATRASPDERLIFYFSGHGHRLNDQLYLVPEDAWIDDDPEALLSLDVVNRLLSASQAKVKIVILDACNTGPSLSDLKHPAAHWSEKFLAEYIRKSEGVVTLASSLADQASSTKSPHPNLSLFTSFIVDGLRGVEEALDEGLLTAGGLFDYVSAHVQRVSKSHHRPQQPAMNQATSGTIVLGDFRKNKGVTSPAPADSNGEPAEPKGNDARNELLDSLGSLDDLPTRPATRVLDDHATKAFSDAITAVGMMFVQQLDRKDDGTNAQLEVAVGESASNVRLHVQIKATDSAVNGDSSVSVSVDRANLNYLLAQPFSFFVCFHAPTERLLARFADDVYADYVRRKEESLHPQTVTVRFRDAFDRAFQERASAMAVSGGRVARDRRLLWSASPPDQLVELIRTASPAIDVPSSVAQAKALLHRLYDEGRDDVISASHYQFRSVLGSPEHARVLGMADINVAINGGSVPEVRLRDAIVLLEAARSANAIPPGPTHYNEGNGWLALKEYQRAIASFDAAIDLLKTDAQALAAQCHKNRGSALEHLGREVEARSAYENALSCDTNLAEARYALGQWLARHANYDAAFAEFELVVRSRRSAIKPASVQGWRAYCLLRSGRVVAGLKLVLDLVGHAQEHKWIWNWCASSVTEFGTFDAEALALSLAFWRHFLAEHPGNAAACFAQLNCAAALHRLDPMRASRAGFDFARFEKEAIALMHLDGSVGLVARLWDWIGHWAQEDGEWAGAAAAYGEANSLDTASYGYCFGVALLKLGRYADAHEVLLLQALKHQPDSLSWAQVAVARENMSDLVGAIEAYKRSIALEPNYALGWFNLGGMYWNHGDYPEAESTWTSALERFPDHELAGETTKLLHAWIARRLGSVPSGSAR